MKKSEIKKAAMAHVESVLGPGQSKNHNAKASIETDFIAGVEWALKYIQSKASETCTKCGGKGKPSKALQNIYASSSDFGNDAGKPGTTMSRTKAANHTNCLKCSKCGHSWVNP